jgi:hypothetical protein
LERLNMQSEHKNQCDYWGKNQTGVDTGCSLGHSQCLEHGCPNYWHACKINRPITARMF